jgi:hypothetical protein
MVRFLYKTFLFFAGFAALAYFAGNKGQRRYVENSDSPVVSHVKSTSEQLNNIEYVSHILQEKANGQHCLIYHGMNQKCVLCDFLDSAELEIDGISYEHNYRTAEDNKYHFVIRKSANPTE